MPLTTLPNPGMDFTPLTPLTAEEMDDIVENIEAVNNATIQTESIANGAITKDKLGTDALSGLDYSTSEIDTGTKWIDGKKIYKKTVDFGQYPEQSGSPVGVAHGISNLDKVIKMEGIMYVYGYSDQTDAFVPIFSGSPYSGGNSSLEVYEGKVWIQRGNIVYGDSQNIYVTLYYTKTS